MNVRCGTDNLNKYHSLDAEMSIIVYGSSYLAGTYRSSSPFLPRHLSSIMSQSEIPRMCSLLNSHMSPWFCHYDAYVEVHSEHFYNQQYVILQNSQHNDTSKIQSNRYLPWWMVVATRWTCLPPIGNSSLLNLPYSCSIGSCQFSGIANWEHEIIFWQCIHTISLWKYNSWLHDQ